LVEFLQYAAIRPRNQESITGKVDTEPKSCAKIFKS
jgi:hypothetical protein